MFDEISVFMECPYCGTYETFDCQTKDLDNVMWSFRPYEKDSFLDRAELSVAPSTPSDKGAKSWKSQDERQRAMATLPAGYDKLKYVDITADCHSIECQFYADRRDIIRQGCPSGFGRRFDGKIAVKNGMLIGIVYDISKSDGLSEKELSKYKKVKPAKFKKLMKKYKHEPIACRNWGL